MIGCLKGYDIHGKPYTLNDEKPAWERDLDINGYQPRQFKEGELEEIEEKLKQKYPSLNKKK